MDRVAQGRSEAHRADGASIAPAGAARRRPCPPAPRPHILVMLRPLSLALAVAAGPAFGWEFSAQPVCTLRYDGAEAAVEVTYDPRQADAYAIALTRPGAAWTAGPLFTITFEGARTLTIGTDRHRLSDDGAVLTVRDRGFENVLDGLELNDRAVAQLDGVAVAVPLDGAAGPVAEFRSCAVTPMS